MGTLEFSMIAFMLKDCGEVTIYKGSYSTSGKEYVYPKVEQVLETLIPSRGVNNNLQRIFISTDGKQLSLNRKDNSFINIFDLLDHD